MRQRTLVVTVTPNPSLDLLFEAQQLVWDDANRIADPRRRPGGQGINVTRAVAALDGASSAVTLLGGSAGAEILSVLQREGTPVRFVPASETRVFVAVRDHDAERSLLLNARGPDRTEGDEEALLRAVADELAENPAEWLACCGSLPPGFAPDFYFRVAQLGRQHGCRVVVDCDGAALRAAAQTCDLLVPNQHEAGRLTGLPVTTLDQAITAIEVLPSRLAAITMGVEGAVLRIDQQIWLARPPFVRGSPVGAGDSFLAGLLVGLGRGLHGAEALRAACAAAAAVLMSQGSDLLRAVDADGLASRIQVQAVK